MGKIPNLISEISPRECVAPFLKFFSLRSFRRKSSNSECRAASTHACRTSLASSIESLEKTIRKIICFSVPIRWPPIKMTPQSNLLTSSRILHKDNHEWKLGAKSSVGDRAGGLVVSSTTTSKDVQSC